MTLLKWFIAFRLCLHFTFPVYSCADMVCEDDPQTITLNVSFDQQAIETINNFYLHKTIYLNVFFQSAGWQVLKWPLPQNDTSYFFKPSKFESFELPSDLNADFQKYVGERMAVILSISLQDQMSGQTFDGEYRSNSIFIDPTHRFIDVQISSKQIVGAITGPYLFLRSGYNPPRHSN